MLDGRTDGGEKRDAHSDKSKLLFLHHLSSSCSFCKKSNRKCHYSNCEGEKNRYYSFKIAFLISDKR